MTVRGDRGNVDGATYAVRGGFAVFGTGGVLGHRGIFKDVRGFVRLCAADTFAPVTVIVLAPFVREFVLRIALADYKYVGVGYAVVFYGRRVRSDHIVGAFALFHDLFDAGGHAQLDGVGCVVRAYQVQGCLVSVCLPRPGSVSEIVTNGGNKVISIAIIAVVAIVKGITVGGTGCGNDGVGINVRNLGRRDGVGLVAVRTAVGGMTVRHTGGVRGACNAPCVSDGVVLDLVGVAASATGVDVVAALGTGDALYLDGVVVAVGLNEGAFLDLLVVTALANHENVSVLGTASLHGLLRVAVSVKGASLGGGQSGYRVDGEVVGLEGDKSVVVRRLDGHQLVCVGAIGALVAGLNLTVVTDKPNGNTVNVFAVGKRIGQGDGDEVVFSEIGNGCAVFVIDVEVVNGIGADLFELFLGNAQILEGVFIHDACRDGDLAVADGVSHALAELNVGVCFVVNLELNVGVRKVGGVGAGGVAVGNYDLSGLFTNRAGILSRAARYVAEDPVVSRCVCRDLFGGFACIAASAASEGFFSGCRAGCGRADACHVDVLIYGFALYRFATAVSAAGVRQNVCTAAYRLFLGGNARDVVSQCVAAVFGIGVAAVTFVGLGCCGATGRRDCQCLVFDIGVGGYVGNAAYVTGVIGVGIAVSTRFQNGTTAIIAEVIGIGVRIGVDAHIVLATAVIAGVVVVAVLMCEGRAGGCATFRTGCGSCTGCGFKRAFGYAAQSANVAAVIVVICRVEASFQNCVTAVIAEVIVVLGGVSMLAKRLVASVVTFVVEVCVLANAKDGATTAITKVIVIPVVVFERYQGIGGWQKGVTQKIDRVVAVDRARLVEIGRLVDRIRLR